MNKIRRKQLEAIEAVIRDAQSRLEDIMQEEEDARDNIPESLMYTERYEKMNEACDFLYDAISNLEESIENIIGAIV